MQTAAGLQGEQRAAVRRSDVLVQLRRGREVHGAIRPQHRTATKSALEIVLPLLDPKAVDRADLPIASAEVNPAIDS